MNYVAAVLLVLLVVSCATLILVVRQLNWSKAVIQWSDEREGFFSKIYQEALVVVTVPRHDFKEDGNGNVAYEGTLLSYGALRSMMTIVKEEESARRVFVSILKTSLNELEVWERDHPVPPRPVLLPRKVA